MAKLPEGFTLQEAVTLPNNFVTVFHTITKDLGIETPWPKPAEYKPEDGDEPIVVWGGASSVGMYALQILRYYGCKSFFSFAVSSTRAYLIGNHIDTSIVAVASKKHHEKLKSLGAKLTFDYNDPDVMSQISSIGTIPRFMDCIGSVSGSIAPISRIAKSGAKVAILLPLIVRDSSETEDPVYEMDVSKVADWTEGVDARGVRTHFYLDVSFESQCGSCRSKY